MKRFAFRQLPTHPWIQFDSIDELKEIPHIKCYMPSQLLVMEGEEGDFLYHRTGQVSCQYLGQLRNAEMLDLPRCIAYQHTCYQIVERKRNV